MLCSVVIASAIVLSPIAGPSYHTVHYFDNLIRVSQRVLDRTICADLERVHTDQNTGEFAKARAEQNRDQVVAHCQKRLRTEGLNIAECDLK